MISKSLTLKLYDNVDEQWKMRSVYLSKRITSLGYESISKAPNLRTSSETWSQIFGQPAGRAVLCVGNIKRYPKSRLFSEFY